MRVDYVIVAYNSADDLTTCLDSVNGDRLPGSQIYVVDNASPDNSAEIAENHPSHCIVLKSDRNGGFGAGCNIAMRESSADAIFLVNPDAVLRDGTTALLVDALVHDDGAAAVGPRIQDPAGEYVATAGGADPSLASFIGHFLLLGRLPGLRLIFRPLHLASASLPAQPDWISGAAMMLRRNAVLALGGFDERIFMYMEDVDLCRRLREAGWHVLYVPDAIVEHAIAGSQGTEQPRRWFRGLYMYVADHRGELHARVAAWVAFLGLSARAVAARRASTQGRRMRTAASAAAECAVFGRRVAR